MQNTNKSVYRHDLQTQGERGWVELQRMGLWKCCHCIPLWRLDAIKYGSGPQRYLYGFALLSGGWWPTGLNGPNMHLRVALQGNDRLTDERRSTAAAKCACVVTEHLCVEHTQDAGYF